MACDASNGATLNAAETECECLTNLGADDLTKVLVEFDESGARYAAGKRCVACPSPDGTAAGARDVDRNGACISCDRIRKKDGTGWIQMTYDAHEDVLVPQRQRLRLLRPRRQEVVAHRRLLHGDF